MTFAADIVPRAVVIDDALDTESHRLVADVSATLVVGGTGRVSAAGAVRSTDEGQITMIVVEAFDALAADDVAELAQGAVVVDGAGPLAFRLADATLA